MNTLSYKIEVKGDILQEIENIMESNIETDEEIFHNLAKM